MKFPELSAEEFLVGAILQAPLFFLVGLWFVPISLVCGLLWAYGGAHGTNLLWRRWGVPAVVYAVIFYNNQSFLSLAVFPLTWLTIAMGYGKTSRLWTFFRGFLSHARADFTTRTILYCLYLLSLVLAVSLS